MNFNCSIKSRTVFSSLTLVLIILFTGGIFFYVSGVSMGVNEEPDIMKIDCGPSPISIETYERISYVSLVTGFGFIFLLTLLNDKILKIGAGIFSLIAFGILGYVYFTVDYDEVRRIIFNYNVQAEQALNNLAEGQDRYKSEYGLYLNDLEKLHSHIAGASGLSRCVKILEIKVYRDYWTATAQQISSPEKVYWDSRKGSSLKKG